VSYNPVQMIRAKLKDELAQYGNMLTTALD
jgi:hypothetical protein